MRGTRKVSVEIRAKCRCVTTVPCSRDQLLPDYPGVADDQSAAPQTMQYNHSKIEKKWQKKWETSKIYQAKDVSKKPKWYSLIEFPYPSGAGLHVGHIRSNTALDIISRKRRMEGFNVLYPIGWDAFGLPTENYAIKAGVSPHVATKQNTDTFRRQLKALGFSFDWSREVDTTDPGYYKWTQWMFLQFFKHGLAYKAKAEINWCPKDKIGLANEEVENGHCERCGGPVEKRFKEQWMLKMTAYAEKLLEGLKKVDFIPEIATQQENWIGKSEGAEIEFPVVNSKGSIKVFTTRPDTLFGATFLVIAPEHSRLATALEDPDALLENKDEVRRYVEAARKKTELERSAEGREKTGVELKGLRVINPATKQEISVWVADYVLGGYGTGAIMAVPAHDVRDFEFATKFSLPITQVIRPVFGEKDKSKQAVQRETVTGVVLSKDHKKILLLKWKEYDWLTGVIGGMEHGEAPAQAAEREVLEETGYTARAIFASPIEIESHFYAEHKKEWRARIDHPVLLEVVTETPVHIDVAEAAKHEVRWIPISQALTMDMFANNKLALHLALSQSAYTGFGATESERLINSGEFTGMSAHEAAHEITKKFGTKKVTYKLRDWVFSRQRYWGEPIPLIHCEHCSWVPVPDKDLPVTLPKVKKYEPTDTGESPLSKIDSWVKVKCPKCKGPATRETDTMPNWAGSSWYFLRYTDPKNKKHFADKKKLSHWLPVDWYNGGMEHATRHLLYARFWNQFFYDIGEVPVSEPFKKRTAHGIILASDGKKMSKSLGNVVNPDELVKEFGADALRLYEMFIGPFNQAVSWDPRGILGTSRFLERVWRIGTQQVDSVGSGDEITKKLHQTIKKVSGGIEILAFNTAISAMMIFVNEFDAALRISRKDFELFVKLLAPFAPHIAEELYELLGNKQSVHLAPWPNYDESLLVESTFELIVQVNGKVRAKVTAPRDLNEAEAKKLALSLTEVTKWLGDAKVKKTVYVQNRLINLIV